jgi:outer membrane biogenesis lipoprotein LolB
MGYPNSLAGWEVEITQWQVIEGWQVPRKIEAYRDDISVRLVVLSWEFEAAHQ